MKSALSIIAFSDSNELAGSVALLETALAALDRAGCNLAAIYVDLALVHVREELNAAGDGFVGIVDHQ